MNPCAHSTIWPDGICTACGVLATLFPGFLDNGHKVIPRAEHALLYPSAWYDHGRGTPRHVDAWTAYLTLWGNLQKWVRENRYDASLVPGRQQTWEEFQRGYYAAFADGVFSDIEGSGDVIQSE